MENLCCGRLVVAWFDQGELDCIVGIAGPYQDGVSSGLFDASDARGSVGQ